MCFVCLLEENGARRVTVAAALSRKVIKKQVHMIATLVSASVSTRGAISALVSFPSLPKEKKKT